MDGILITGGSAGIGEALAKRFYKKGFIILVGRDMESLKRVKGEIELRGGGCDIYSFDLGKGNVDDLWFDVTRRYKVDMLVNNAGFGYFGEFVKGDISMQLKMIDVNIRALTHLSFLFAEYKIKRREQGIIVNISSTASFFPIPYTAVYAATKAYVTSFSEAIRKELEDYGIKVITICPGGTKTKFQERANFPTSMYSFQNFMTADEVAEEIEKAVEKNKSPYIPGIRNRIFISLGKRIPLTVLMKIIKRFSKLSLTKK